MQKKILSRQEFHQLSTPIETNWVVITGAPSSGKSTLIEKLSKMGYRVLNDVAREIFLEMKANSVKIDEKKKQILIVERLIEKYCTISTSELVFLDYGMPDNIVFQTMLGFSSEVTANISEMLRYKYVFLLTPLEIEYDGVRKLDHEGQNIIYRNILNIYNKFKYNPIIIKSTDTSSRLNIILNHIKENI